MTAAEVQSAARPEGTSVTGFQVPRDRTGGRVKLTWLGGRGEKRRMSTGAPSASYSLTGRGAIQNRPGMLGPVAMANGEPGRDMRALGLVECGAERIHRGR